jgi:hypothetical protein
MMHYPELMFIFQLPLHARSSWNISLLPKYFLKSNQSITELCGNSSKFHAPWLSKVGGQYSFTSDVFLSLLWTSLRFGGARWCPHFSSLCKLELCNKNAHVYEVTSGSTTIWAENYFHVVILKQQAAVWGPREQLPLVGLVRVQNFWFKF